MSWEFLKPSSDWRREKLSHRAVALALAIFIEALFLLMLLQIVPSPFKKAITPELKTFDVMPEEAPAITPKPAKAGGAPPAKSVTPPSAPVIAKTIPRPILNMSHEEFAATDISKLPKAGGDNGAGSGKGSGSAIGPGEGPGGEPMYNAEWYREPSHGELAQYLPNGAPAGSWGMVACKTIPNYGVENCQQLGESPVGTGISKALRLAAWQFKVRPPRIGGKALIGVWVRIRFDFTKGPGDSDRPPVRDGRDGPD
jgi:protein TonB